MRRWFSLLIFAVICFLNIGIVSTVSAQQSPAKCPYTTSESYQPNSVPIYDGVNKRLLLVDWSTGEELHILKENAENAYNFSWSPNCRYLVGTLRGYHSSFHLCDDGLMIWDSASGEVKVALDGFCDTLSNTYPHIYWKSDSSMALLTEWFHVANGEGSIPERYFWNSTSSSLTELQSDYYELYYQPNLYQIEWDEERNWLWTSGDGAVFAFDQQTGKLAARFENKTIPPWRKQNPFLYETVSYFAFSPDRTKIIVHGQARYDKRTAPVMRIYDIASGQGIEVNVELNGKGEVALSPDNRYLVMGYQALRVWDLQNLPEKVEDRLPIYRYEGPLGQVQSLHFIDGTTLETTSPDGAQRWDILTGKLIS